ncbi:MAG: hypothetical protein AB2813_03350 [Candidatus Sedimenticola endophacoides]
MPNSVGHARGEKQVLIIGRLPLLHVANRAREWDQVLEMEGLSSAIARKSLTLSSTALALSAAIEGAGVALSDRRMIERELEYGQLVIPFDIRFETKNAFYTGVSAGTPADLRDAVLLRLVAGRDRAAGKHLRDFGTRNVTGQTQRTCEHASPQNRDAQCFRCGRGRSVPAGTPGTIALNTGVGQR